MSDTICALSSGVGAAGVAVVRISGAAAGEALESVMGRPLPVPRRATLACISDPRTGELLDRGLAIWFPAPDSFTGENVGELHLHGGRSVVAGVLEALVGLDGVRLAGPGEFTRRAYEHGKLDLTAAEGIADLVAAETAAQRRQALRQAGGTLATLYEGWRDRLVRVLAHLEADIDFSDEEELPADVWKSARSEILRMAAEIARHLDDGHRGERLRNGFRVALVGAPNTGKSSLLNRLARREAAIVSATAGTTRDVIEVDLDLRGYPVTIVDTAGLRSVDDEVEREGVRRARTQAKEADLRLVVFDATGCPPTEDPADPDDANTTLGVLNKVDLQDPGTVEWRGREVVRVSALTGRGLDDLVREIAEIAASELKAIEAPVLTRVRHREALGECRGALDRAARGADAELVAEDVRLAVRALGRITGRVDVEDVLDVIFREFCIGK
ncbi:MAG: tRNA uridine-5-carboxymethylaminomethyl(34) synthesis GTPase MnmE [Alphaproteobacteria bacterium]